MEIKATLNKPYTEKQRADFIVENNHQYGYEIKETETALEAWGLTDEEQEEQRQQARNTEIEGKITELNNLTVEYMRQGDTKSVEVINNIISSLKENLG